MMEQDEEHGEHEDLRLAKAVGKGVVMGIPIALIALTAAILAITRNDLADSFATAILPGTLLGVFFGGFVGMVKTMD